MALCSFFLLDAAWVRSRAESFSQPHKGDRYNREDRP